MFHDMFGGMWFGWLFWIAVIVLVVILVLKLPASNKNNNSNKTPMDILKRRYAKGEITKEQFEQMKKDINE